MSEPAHLRGVRVVEGDAARPVRVLVGLALVGLAVLTIILTISAATQNSRMDRLRQHGVPVTATVTGCLGVGSGVGMGIEYWQCRGSYTLDGQEYNAVIGGSRAHVPDGQAVTAIAVPGDPASLTAASVVAHSHDSRTPYVTPVILGAVTIAGSVWAILWFRRRGAPRPTE